MAWLWLIGGFFLFMVFISAMNALDRYASAGFGYRPLALPNLALMLIPHGIAVADISGLVNGSGMALPAAALWLTAAVGLAVATFVLWTIGRRTRTWIAVAATLAMVAAASVLLFSMLFQTMADTSADDPR